MPIFDHFDFFIPPKDLQEMRKFSDLPASGALLIAGSTAGKSRNPRTISIKLGMTQAK